MSRATLTIEPAPGSPSARVVVVDCRHGVTTVAYANGSGSDVPPITDADAVQVALLRHFSAERCACTRQLRERYGLGRRAS